MDKINITYIAKIGDWFKIIETDQYHQILNIKDNFLTYKNDNNEYKQIKNDLKLITFEFPIVELKQLFKNGDIVYDIINELNIKINEIHIFNNVTYAILDYLHIYENDYLFYYYIKNNKVILDNNQIYTINKQYYIDEIDNKYKIELIDDSNNTIIKNINEVFVLKPINELIPIEYKKSKYDIIYNINNILELSIICIFFYLIGRILFFIFSKTIFRNSIKNLVK